MRARKGSFRKKETAPIGSCMELVVAARSQLQLYFKFEGAHWGAPENRIEGLVERDLAAETAYGEGHDVLHAVRRVGAVGGSHEKVQVVPVRRDSLQEGACLEEADRQRYLGEVDALAKHIRSHALQPVPQLLPLRLELRFVLRRVELPASVATAVLFALCVVQFTDVLLQVRHKRGLWHNSNTLASVYAIEAPRRSPREDSPWPSQHSRLNGPLHPRHGSLL